MIVSHRRELTLTDVDDKEDVLKLLNPRIDGVNILISDRIIAHSLTLKSSVVSNTNLYYILRFGTIVVAGVPIHILLILLIIL